MIKIRDILLILVIGCVFVSACTSPNQNSAPKTTITQTASPVATTQIIANPNPQINLTIPVTSQSIPVTTVFSTIAPQPENSKIIIDETFSLISGERNSAKIYSFKDYGLEFLKPKDTFIISVDSAKPINILVTDAAGKARFNGVTPVWEKQPTSKTTDTRLYGYSYPGIWYVQKADEVFHKDLLLKIDRADSYYLILDPQTIVEQVSELGIWQTKQNSFNAQVKVNQVLNPQSLDILPKSPYIIEDTTAIYSAYRDGFKEYPLEDYGLTYLYSGDTFRLSINGEKPVNVFVLDVNEEEKFDNINPVYEMQPAKGDMGSQYGYTYDGISPLVKEDNVVKKDITFTVKKTGKYFIVIDQRFADPYSKDISFFKADVKLSKI